MLTIIRVDYFLFGFFATFFAPFTPDSTFGALVDLLVDFLVVVDFFATFPLLLFTFAAFFTPEVFPLDAVFATFFLGFLTTVALSPNLNLWLFLPSVLDIFNVPSAIPRFNASFRFVVAFFSSPMSYFSLINFKIAVREQPVLDFNSLMESVIISEYLGCKCTFAEVAFLVFTDLETVGFAT